MNVNVTDIAFWEKSNEIESLAWPYTASGLYTTEIKSLYPEPPYPYASFMLGLVTVFPTRWRRFLITSRAVIFAVMASAGLLHRQRRQLLRT